MMTATESELVHRPCKPCEGGFEPASTSEARDQVAKLPGWQLSDDGLRIRKQWVVQNFTEAIEFFQKVAQVAEAEDHHPDLHLTGYRNVAIELSTHAIGGLSENDFILAAKIDQIPVNLKRAQT